MSRARKKDIVLVLNKSYFPLRTETIQQTFTNMAKGSYLGIDFEYAQDEDGNYNLDEMTSMIAIKSFDEWYKLPIRSCDDVINTVRGPVRVPPVVCCASFNKIKFPRVQFPNSHNIFKRDKYTCGYTGKKLPKEKLSVDHIIPKSLGGKDTWENLITCDRELNGWKGNRLNHECGLKLQFEPTKPTNGLVFQVIRDEWRAFVKDLTA